MTKVLILLAILPLAIACTKKGGRDRQPILAPNPAETVIGVTAEEENFQAGAGMDTDSALRPAVAYRRSSSTYDAIEVVRRTELGWGSPALVSDDSSTGNVKTEPHVAVSRNNDYVHIFWNETAGAALGIHYALFDTSNPPVRLVADTVISTVVPANVPLGTVGAVTADTLTVTIDRTNSNVYVAWAQLVTAAGAAAADETVVVGAIAGGWGSYDEPVAMLVPDTGATTADVVATADPPIVLGVASAPAVGDGGTLHVLWTSTTVTGGSSTRRLRHRTRTASATYSGPSPNGDEVSDVAGENIRFARLLLADDGDAYVAWAQTTPLPVKRVEGAYRPTGESSSFLSSAVLSPDPGSSPDEIVALRAFLGSGEIPHVFYKRASGGSLRVYHQGFSSNPASGWGGVSHAEAGFGPVTYGGSSAGTVFGHVDERGTVVLVWDAPRDAGGSSFDVFHALRASFGSFGASANLTDTADDSRLDNLFSWWWGWAHVVVIEGPSTGAREVMGLWYFSDGGFSGSVNRSESFLTDSHGDGEPGQTSILGTDDGVTHLLFREHTGSTTHDLFYDHD